MVNVRKNNILEKNHQGKKGLGFGLVFPSADPHTQPAIEPNFLADDWDLERMVEGIELALPQLSIRLPERQGGSASIPPEK